MITNPLYKGEARNKMKAGVDKLADAVKVTIGPKGRNVAIRNLSPNSTVPIMTKDGVTVAKTINLADKVEDMGAQLVKEAAIKTMIMAGDGTTTSTVLAQKIISEGMAALEKGANPMDLKRGIDKAVECAVAHLNKISTQVNGDSEKIKNIATISANNDEEIGKIISEAMMKVGIDGHVYQQESKDGRTYIEVIEGLQIDKGYITPHFINNQRSGCVEFKDPYILIYDKKISMLYDIEPILEKVVQAKKPLLIIADDVDGEALNVMVTNKLRKGLEFAAIKIPGFGMAQKEFLEDVAIATGATVISEEQGYKLRDTHMELLGRAKHITIDRNKTVVIGGIGKKDKVNDRIESLKSLILESKNEFEQQRLKLRLAILSEGVAIMNVGAPTEIEMKEKGYRIEDALCATRAAIEEGIVPGGGVSYIKCIASVQLLESDNTDEETGIDIILSALEEPILQILANAGIVLADGVVQKIKEGKKVDHGFNAKTGIYENFFTTGVIDPCKVARVALENAASVAAMFLTTECVISDID